jgi:hypothetical protein
VRDQRPISGTVLLIDGATVRGRVVHGLVPRPILIES